MTTQEFAAKLNADNQQLVDKIQACKAPEEAYAVAKDTGVTDSFEDFTSEMTKIYESIKDLSEDDLSNVAGGSKAYDVAATISASAASAVTLASLVSVVASAV